MRYMHEVACLAIVLSRNRIRVVLINYAISRLICTYFLHISKSRFSRNLACILMGKVKVGNIFISFLYILMCFLNIVCRPVFMNNRIQTIRLLNLFYFYTKVKNTSKYFPPMEELIVVVMWFSL